MNTSYARLLDQKRTLAPISGFEVDERDLNPMLFPHQRLGTAWGIQRGKAANLWDTGLGKSAALLTWADYLSRKTDQPFIIFAPLSVTHQIKREADKFGYDARVCRSQADVRPGLNITNYHRIHLFDKHAFGGMVCDESSSLKGDGPLKNGICEFGVGMPYRLACTATPAPNELLELANHAEYLGVMEQKEITATFFSQKGNSSHTWELKRHAKRDWWRWVASWAAALRKPSDWGFDDTGYALPPFHLHEHVVETSVEAAQAQGQLFEVEARGIKDQRRVRKSTLADRVAIAAELANAVTEPVIVWADLNPESEALRKAIPDCVEVTGSQSEDVKEAKIEAFLLGKARVLVTKPSIAGHGLNLQHCAMQVWCGRSNSYEQWYQGVRRSWRFGQTREVHIHQVMSDADGQILRNQHRKALQAMEMMDELIEAVRRDGLVMNRAARSEMDYAPERPLVLPSWLKGA
jgi:hypothetical protein